ncbi:MAG: electron transfer flavoprotein subunit alpha/FixB family protein, partial [Bacilli bacterium]
GRLKTGLTADATMIDVDPLQDGDKLLWITRPAFGGNLYGTIICPNHRPQMATIRPGVFEKEIYNNNGDVIDFYAQLSESDLKQEILEIVATLKEGVDISKADIIISGGRGIGGKAGFDKLQEIAHKIDAVVGGSRGAVDLGWIEKEKQVGQTGSTVKPQIYIACGISGAVQHTAGMDKSDCIIAINKDEFAPIFDCAHIGIVGDVFEVLDELKNEIIKIKELKENE